MEVIIIIIIIIIIKRKRERESNLIEIQKEKIYHPCFEVWLPHKKS